MSCFPSRPWQVCQGLHNVQLFCVNIKGNNVHSIQDITSPKQKSNFGSGCLNQPIGLGIGGSPAMPAHQQLRTKQTNTFQDHCDSFDDHPTHIESHTAERKRAMNMIRDPRPMSRKILRLSSLFPSRRSGILQEWVFGEVVPPVWSTLGGSLILGDSWLTTGGTGWVSNWISGSTLWSTRNGSWSMRRWVSVDSRHCSSGLRREIFCTVGEAISWFKLLIRFENKEMGDFLTSCDRMQFG